MKKQYEYEVDEWSQDTRKWVFTSNRKLTVMVFIWMKVKLKQLMMELV